MIAENAAFTYALLRTPVALYPRSIFRRYCPLTDDDYGPSTLVALRETTARYREQEQQARGQEKAFLQLLIRGAEGALSFLEDTDLSGFDTMATIQAYYPVVEEYYQDRMGFEWDYSPPVVVNQYPEPAQDADWFAVSGVPGGPRPGYPQGIYFLRRHMMPGVVELATLHENVHHLGMGSISGSGYYRYFDEGCANFLAYLVYLHKNQDLDAIRLYRAFLQEINTELYEYPSFDRIIASLVQQVGVAGFYRLIVRRLSDVDSLDWQAMLRALGKGDPVYVPGELANDEIPATVHELQEGAQKMIGLITYPKPMAVSPVAYLAYERTAEEGSLDVRHLQDYWDLSEKESSSVVAEFADVYLWAEADGRLSLSGTRSDLFHGTGLIRAGATNPGQLE